MSLVVKVVVAVALATAALWAPSRVPVTAPPASPALWSDASALAGRITDTLSTEAAIGQLIAARSGTDGLDEMVRQGRVGRVEVSGGGTDAHLSRLRRWRDTGALPILVATGQGSELALPFADAPAFASPSALAAGGRLDLAYLSGNALAQSAVDLGVQSPGVPMSLGVGGSAFGLIPGGPVVEALARGLREGGVLASAFVRDDEGLTALPDLGRAGLMEVRLVVDSPDDVERVAAIQQLDGFSGLIQTEVDRRATRAVDAVRAGADVVLSDAPAVVRDSLLRAVEAGRLSATRVQAAARRVLSAKAWAGLALAPPARGGGDQRPSRRLDAWRPPTPALVHRAGLVRREASRAAITVLQEPDGPLPLVGAGVPPVTFVVVLDPGVQDGGGLAFVNTLAEQVAPEGRASYVRLGLGQGPEPYETALDVARDANLVVVAALPDPDGELAPRHRAFVDRLDADTPTVLVALGDARLAAGLPRYPAAVIAYADDDAAQRAAAFAMTGRADVRGRLAVGVAGVAAAGAGVDFGQQALRPGSFEEAGLDAQAADRVDAVMEQAVRDGAFPGAAVAIGRDGVLLRLKGYGRLSRTGASVTEDTPYDLASLTKVVGTTAAAMRLVEQKRLDLDERVTAYLPDYHSLGKDRVTIRQLLAHSAGHRPWYPFWSHGITDRQGALDFIYADTLRYRPGAESRYSDFDMILLGEVIEAVTGDRLGDVFDEQIFQPLAMRHSGFREVGVVDREVAPTESDQAFRGRMLQGEVHDEAASVMGGVAGHAGLFSTARDMSRFAYVMANGGAGYGTRLVRRTTLEQFARPIRLRSTYPTGLGWMVNAGKGNTSAGEMGPRAFGHTGYTGTSIWIDPDQRSFVVLLSNRVHPSRRNRRIREVRPALADALVEAIRTPPGRAIQGWGFGPVPDDLLTTARR